eukprot:jgi/Mesen1/9761/ME000007S09816
MSFKVTPVDSDPKSSSTQAAKKLENKMISNQLFPTPPFSLNMPGESHKKRKGLLSKVLSLLTGFRPGGDLTKVRIPPYLNMPKSQLQIYGESVYCSGQDFLSACADGATPVERFLNVVRWHISLIRPTPFAKAPFNPILGETHHVSAGDLHVLIEQVSHHPPKFALFGQNKKKDIKVTMVNQLVPSFYGSWIEVEARGGGTVHLGAHAEDYTLTAPRISFRLFPVPGTEWVGTTRLTCPQSHLEAEVHFVAKGFCGIRGTPNRIRGKQTGVETILYDARSAISRLPTPEVVNPKALLPTESLVVWGKLTKALLDDNWGAARHAKSEVEEWQREVRRARQAAGAPQWQPKYFTPTAGGDYVFSSSDIPEFRQPAPVQVFNDWS